MQAGHNSIEIAVPRPCVACRFPDSPSPWTPPVFGRGCVMRGSPSSSNGRAIPLAWKTLPHRSSRSATQTTANCLMPSSRPSPRESGRCWPIVASRPSTDSALRPSGLEVSHSSQGLPQCLPAAFGMPK